MPFKIVRTIENNKPQLCICPSLWEKDGLLKWPKKHSARLIKDENAIAEPKWREIKCVVKRNDLLSYEAAEKELGIMLDNTDTEHEGEQMSNMNTFRRPQQRPEPVNFNDLANQLIQGESCVNSSTSTFTLPVESGETYFLVPDNGTTETSTVSNADTNTMKLILQNQSVLREMTNIILKNQKKIMHELANLSVQMEEYSKNTDQYNVKYLKDISGSVENTSFNIKQIENIQDLEFFEMTLSDNEQKIKMKNTLKCLCASGEGNAKNCAFRLVDIIFSRDFLCKCSWSGSSRSDGVKISLKCFKKTLNFFFEVIKLWDDSYTLEENEKFFKDILKNSNKRINSKLERISTKRYRKKIDMSHKKQKTDDFDVMINDNGLESILAINLKEPRNFNDNSETTNDNAKKTNDSGDYENEDDQTEDEESLC